MERRIRDLEDQLAQMNRSNERGANELEEMKRKLQAEIDKLKAEINAQQERHNAELEAEKETYKNVNKLFKIN